MRFDRPDEQQLPQLLQLWKTAFGDHSGFWELFLDTAFSAEHCRCITENGQVTAALCWFDCGCRGQKYAYIYAVVTHPEHRNRGLCRALLDDTHNHLTAQGFSAAMLVPEKAPLRQMYEKLGYQTCTWLSEFSCAAGDMPVPLRAIGPKEYAALRREYLPKSGVIQENENLTFLAAQAQFFVGDDYLLAAYEDAGTLYGMELLGNREAAPGVLRALNCKKGNFRAPGKDKPFAMYHPLRVNAVAPEYFGFAFD